MARVRTTSRHHSLYKTHLVGFLLGKPHGGGLLAADHEVDIVLCPQAMRHRAEEAVGIWWEINTSQLRLEVKNSADKRWVLVREPVVLLSRPCGGLEIVEGTDRLTPRGFMGLDYGRSR